jgi:probable addiction module antidote protein
MAVTDKQQAQETSDASKTATDDPKKAFRDNELAVAAYLTKAFACDDFPDVLSAIRTVIRAQNVKILAKEGGLRRDRLYHTFNGEVDPQLSRVMKLFKALNVRLAVVALGPRERPTRPKLGRPKKIGKL